MRLFQKVFAVCWVVITISVGVAIFFHKKESSYCAEGVEAIPANCRILTLYGWPDAWVTVENDSTLTEVFPSKLRQSSLYYLAFLSLALGVAFAAGRVAHNADSRD